MGMYCRGLAKYQYPRSHILDIAQYSCSVTYIKYTPKLILGNSRKQKSLSLISFIWCERLP